MNALKIKETTSDRVERSPSVTGRRCFVCVCSAFDKQLRSAGPSQSGRVGVGVGPDRVSGSERRDLGQGLMEWSVAGQTEVPSLWSPARPSIYAASDD